MRRVIFDAKRKEHVPTTGRFMSGGVEAAVNTIARISVEALVRSMVVVAEPTGMK